MYHGPTAVGTPIKTQQSLLRARPLRQNFSRMGTSSDLLRQVALRGYVARRDFSHPHYPPTTAGYIQWAMGNKVLRDVHVERGWTCRNDQGVAKTVAQDGSFAITMLAGDDETGLEYRIPSTRYPRGSKGAEDVIDNRQGDLFGYSPPVPIEKTWFLLVSEAADKYGRLLRMELSLPWQLDKAGSVIRWHRRIILPETRLDEGFQENEERNDTPPEN